MEDARGDALCHVGAATIPIKLRWLFVFTDTH